MKGGCFGILVGTSASDLALRASIGRMLRLSFYCEEAKIADNSGAVVIKDVDGRPTGAFKEPTLAGLPDNDVLIEVAYSSFNCKDGLAVAGKGKIAHRRPVIAGKEVLVTGASGVSAPLR